MAKSALKGGMKPQRARNKFLREERDRKRKEAAARQDAANSRTPVEQLAKLDAGGYVAAKERIKLHSRINQGQEAISKKELTELPVLEEPKKDKKGTKARRQSKKDKKGNK